MTPSHLQMRRLLDGTEFAELFRRLGWDDPPAGLAQIGVADTPMVAGAVADKRGVLLWAVVCEELPSRADQHRVVRAVTRHSRGVLLVFSAPDEQRWLWPEQRSSGVGFRLVDHTYIPGAGNDALLQRLGDASFTIDEEDSLNTPKVLARVRRSFNVEKVTKRFYVEFKKHHDALVQRIEGIPDHQRRRWYASVLLNRLMFVYFVQRKGFLDGDTDYLRNRLRAMQQNREAGALAAEYFRGFLVPLFHRGLGERQPSFDDPETSALIGRTPYVNGGIFEEHPLERAHEISVPDVAFEELFDFFGQWRWHLDERPSGHPREINPDVLGFIFEQHVNQRQQGAYYTKPDVTEFMTTSVVVPAVIDRLVAAGLDDPCVLLPRSGDDYLHDSLGYGRERELPAETPPSEYPGETLDLALPGERWCDVLHRRARYEELCALVDDGQVADVDAAVTQNLNLRVLIDDYLRTLANPAEVQAALNVLRSLTICDPTVGSGAFLFAALDVLDDMYTALLERAEELESKGRGSAPFLAEAHAHSSPRYWLLKTICLHNLYGVDLMAEAGEIAKLRLFLKLAAQLDYAEQMEPLPDLDFNIKAGNLLVGIADSEDAERRFGEGRIPSHYLQTVKDEVDRLAAAYEGFVTAQTEDPGGAADVVAKQILIDRFDVARSVADEELFRLRGEAGDIARWRESHRPCHWFVEFPSVWRNGGFDVIVGNPPYIKVTGNQRERFSYTWQGYRTGRCPDIYSVCMERASGLLNDSGRFSMVVMHSLCRNKGFDPLRKYLLSAFGTVWVSSYARIPDCLFTGSARVRNSIVVAVKSGNERLFTAGCRRWLTEGRATLFATQQYTKPEVELLSQGSTTQWPFIDNPDVVEAFSRIIRSQAPLSSDIARDGDFKLGFKKVAQYTLAVFIDPPPVVLADGTETTSEHDGQLSFPTADQRDLSFLTLASRWMYLWWSMRGDEFNVTKSTLTSFPGGIGRLASASNTDSVDHGIGIRLCALADQLREELPTTLKWKANAGIQVGRYDLRECAHITDEADWLLAQAWGLTREQHEAAGSLRDRMTFGQRD